MTFQDIHWEPFQMIGKGWRGTLEIGPYTLSVGASDFHYSSPRKNLSSPQEYIAYEVAVMKGFLFVTEEVRSAVGFRRDEINADTDVLGWIPREVIDEIISYLEEVGL